jgi:hypothetical protein
MPRCHDRNKSLRRRTGNPSSECDPPGIGTLPASIGQTPKARTVPGEGYIGGQPANVSAGFADVRIPKVLSGTVASQVRARQHRR